MKRFSGKRFSPVATPYGVRESVYWLYKYATGLSRLNADVVKAVPRIVTLNPEIKPCFRLAFAGDIMPVEAPVRIADRLKEFVGDADCFIANFEGTISEAARGALHVSDRRHSPATISLLKNIFPPERTFLSVANNHAGDFGEAAFFKSLYMLEAYGFHTFGCLDRPFADVNDGVRVTGGSAWSNRRADFICRLNSPKKFSKPGAFNILFPHFGYEFELFPRRQTVALAWSLAEGFDALVGHHSHCPQPVTIEQNGHKAENPQKLIAYSLGNFLATRRNKNYHSGLLLKLGLGRDRTGRLAAATLEWREIKARQKPDKEFFIEIS